LSRPGASGFLIVGAGPIGRLIGQAIQKEHLEVLLVDTNNEHIRDARLAGLPVMPGNALSHSVADAIALSSIGRMIATTPNTGVNSLAVLQYGRQFGKQNVYQLASAKKDRKPLADSASSLRGQVLFDDKLTWDKLSDEIDAGATIRATKLTKEFDYAAYKSRHPDSFPLFVINERRELSVVTPDATISPKAGSSIISLTKPA
jgi:Trk K+ transport system NAD-binding subunit